MDKALEGGCLCGQIRYRITEVFDAGWCHCSICRRLSGSAALAWANVPTASFELLQGAPLAYAASDRGSRRFCGTCGSGLFWAEDGGAFVSFGIGTLDDPQAVRPRAHICYADKLSWFETADDLPRYLDNRLPHPEERGG
jgi:hypothetical protein